MCKNGFKRDLKAAVNLRAVAPRFKAEVSWWQKQSCLEFSLQSGMFGKAPPEDLMLRDMKTNIKSDH